MLAMAPALPLESLRAAFGRRLTRHAPLARLTAARVGGEADALVTTSSAAELAATVRWLWQAELPFLILGGGSNMLISDAGVRGVVVANKARRVRFEEGPSPAVWAESGANFGALARQAAIKGLGGLEWAAGIPGTVGGAVVGNAGAHDGDLAGNLLLADILHKEEGRQAWEVEKMAYAYRSSALKRSPGSAVVLAATLKLEPRPAALIQAKMDRFLAHRRRTQPPGASMGSMFKNPPGDYAGRLIEAAGLEGARTGQAEISALHANFFLNLGGASAADIYRLIELARSTVAEKFSVYLELEIELAGDWSQAIS